MKEYEILVTGHMTGFYYIEEFVIANNVEEALMEVINMCWCGDTKDVNIYKDQAWYHDFGFNLELFADLIGEAK